MIPAILRKTILLAAFLAIALPASLRGQTLVVDRNSPGLSEISPNAALQSASWRQNDKAFLADDFHLGKTGEIWFIDTIRTWIVTDEDLAGPGVLNNLYSKITLLGGIADSNFSRDAKAPDCDCHGVVPIKTIDLEKERWTAVSSDLKIVDPRGAKSTSAGKVAKRLVQVEFTNLRWSVPAGDVQFGIQAVPRSAAAAARTPWASYSRPGEPFHLRLFSNDGRLVSAYEAKGQQPLRISVQVWAHLSANVSVRSLPSEFQVILHGMAAFDPKSVDVRSLKLGNTPIAQGHRISFEDTDRDGRQDLVVSFPKQSFNPPPNSNICLAGVRSDQVPFEGCTITPR
jgi:hypothetical protein